MSVSGLGDERESDREEDAREGDVCLTAKTIIKHSIPTHRIDRQVQSLRQFGGMPSSSSSSSSSGAGRGGAI